MSVEITDAPEVGAPPRPDPPRKGLRNRRGLGSRALNAAMIVLISYLIIVPLVVLFYSSLKASTTELPFNVEGFSLENYAHVFGSSRLAEVTLNTAIYVIGSLSVALVLSVSLAYLLERTDIPFRRVLAPLTLAPMAVPVVVMAIAWALVANPANGPLAILVRQTLGLQIDIYSLPGMIVVMGIFGVPSMYLMIAPAFARLNPELEEAAAAAGAPLMRRLRLIVFPLIGPAVSAASMLLIVVVLEGFSIPALLGLPDQIFVFSSLIQHSLEPPTGAPNYGQATTYGVLMLLISLSLLLIYRRRIRDANRFKVVVGKAYRQTRTPLGKWRIPIFIVVALYMVIGIILPILALLWTSLSPFSRPITWDGLSDLTFTHFEKILTDPGLGVVMLNTAIVVFVTATVATAMSVWIAVAAHRKSFRGSNLLFESTYLVFGIPSVVLGAAVLFLYLFVPIPIYGTVWIIIVALVTRFLPRGSRMVQTALLQVDEGLIESARVTGASSATVTIKILLPLLRQALWKCWLWVFAQALGELPIALLLTSADNRTLVIEVWDTFTSSVNYPQASALAVIILVISMIAVLLVNRRGASEKEA
jgi:iron(III) transport system permease protein